MKKNEILIGEILKETGGHLSAEDIYFAIKSHGYKISLATIYNNLNTMCDKHIIRKIPIPNGKDVYDKAFIPHGHMICTKCHSICDFSGTKIETQIAEITGIKPLSYDLNVYYICKKCINI